MLYNRIPITIGQFQSITGPTVSYQYDIEQYLVFNSVTLPDYYTVDFCNVGDSQTVTITGTPDGVRIPDELLLTGRDIKAYVVLTGTDEGAVETRYEITLPVRNRPMRQGVTPTPEERLEIETLVNALNDGVTRAEDAATEAEGQADRAETAAENAETAVTHYPKIEDGYWYVWLNGGWVNTGVKAEGVDGKGIASVTGQKTSTSGLVDTYTLTVTYTDSTTDTITFTVTNGRDGVDGYSPTATVTKSGDTATITITDKNGTTNATVTDGTDGVSPGVTIETITGGHRVIITDKDHPTGQSFDVLDGEVSAADLQAVADSKAPVIIDTASGTIASFVDGADGMPVKSLVCQINPLQDLHGQDAPYPPRGGGNLLDFANPSTTSKIDSITDNGSGTFTVVANSGSAYMNYEIPVIAGETYCISCTSASATSGSASRLSVAYVYDGSGTSGTALVNGQTVTTPRIFTPTQSTVTVSWRSTASGESGTGKINEPIVNKGTTPISPWKPYSNVCPIIGWTGLSLTRDGKNLCEGAENLLVGIDSEKATILNANGTCLVAHVVKGQMYVFSNTNLNRRVVTYWDAIPSVGDYTNTFQSLAGNSFTALKTGLVLIYIYNAVASTDDAQIELGSSASTYEAYQGETIAVDWEDEAGTVYGGTDDPLTGALVSSWYLYEPGNTASISLSSQTDTVVVFDLPLGNNRLPNGVAGHIISNQFSTAIPSGNAGRLVLSNQHIYFVVDKSQLSSYDQDGARAWLAAHPTQFCYELAQPVEYQLDHITISTLYGTNNIFADCGTVEVSYPCDTKLYIDRPTEPAEDDMIADTLIASGKYFFVNNRLFLSTASIAVGAMIIPGSNCTETSIAEALNTLNS